MCERDMPNVARDQAANSETSAWGHDLEVILYDNDGDLEPQPETSSPQPVVEQSDL